MNDRELADLLEALLSDYKPVDPDNFLLVSFSVPMDVARRIIAALRRDWLHGWPRTNDHVLVGTSLRCAGCGQSQGTITIAITGDWTPPGLDPDWPFPESDCPVHSRKTEPAEPLDKLTRRALALRERQPLRASKTEKAIVRAAMAWWRYSDVQYSNSVDSDLVQIEISKAWRTLARACARHTACAALSNEPREKPE
jgi:hypothetical protein